MYQPNRILVGVDGSTSADAAFAQALVLAQARGAALTILHAVPADQPFNRGGRERRAFLTAFRQRAEAAGVTATVDVHHGDAAGIILLYDVSRRPDLIVLGTNARKGLERLRTGSVAEDVVRRAERPVLIVPETGARPLGRILVGVDFSAASEAAVAHALALTPAPHRVTLVHVLPGHLSSGAPRAWHRSGAEEYRRGLTIDAWRQLRETATRAASGQTPFAARVTTGRRSTELARVARELDADLIVLGVRRRGAIGRIVLGGTAIDVLRAGGPPLLAVPEPAAVHRAPPIAPERLAA